VRPAAPLARPERVELIAAVYDKALQRNDFSGLNQTRVSTIMSGAYNTYGAPIEIVVGCAFLYELLGCVLRFFLSSYSMSVEGMLIGFGHGHRWSAFAVVLNSYVVRRRVRMHKGELKARDGRMSMMNEFIGSVRGSPSFTFHRLVCFSRFWFLFTAKERKG
jgi:predicted alternative tryptophan synthase beta-subunit